MTRSWVLPITHEVTNDIDEWLVAWAKLTDPICAATGAEVYGLDPGVSFRFEGMTINMPSRFAKALADALKGE